MNRENTDSKVLSEANRRAVVRIPEKMIKPVSEIYKDIQAKRVRKVLRATDSDPAKFATFQREGQEWELPNRRVGRPRFE